MSKLCKGGSVLRTTGVIKRTGGAYPRLALDPLT